MEIGNFWKCLFNGDEAMCLTDTPKGTKVYFIEGIPINTFFSINPLYPAYDNNPTEDWHSKNIGRRADCNVSEFRNILIEMDKIPISEQEQYITEIGLPYSTAVYSGGKSIHFIVSLEQPLKDIKEYRSLVERVYRAVGREKVDLANKNPSRLSRAPGHLREDTGKEQKLLTVKDRIPNLRLEDWLISRGAEPVIWEEIPRRRTGQKTFSSLAASTKNFLLLGTKDSWNLSLFKASADLCRNGWSIEEAIAELKGITGTLDSNDMKTIKSAYKNEENQNG